ncbi:Tetratricopeptide repeat-containing protein [Roseovarius litoreus]|uniref:Tetratricopeptide repeat-containing protein n=1 Tax=Roseovarius litoreus TaxID=1155722 RepID=A0A1M7DR03_9RHOB|nr:tetratricopeptide repeat protein [Roseovarius litoreus]SHL81803.1 Tetratricopeptide repeat-containing protein [Roseovarius litoreus]
MMVERIQALLQAGDWVGAAAMLAPLVEGPRSHPSLIYNYGKVLIELGRFPEAILQLKRVTEVAPGHDAAWFELGRAALGVEDFETAFTAFSRALTLVPNDADARRNLGRVALRLGRYDIARRAWRAFPGDPEAALALYRVAAETGDPEAEAMRVALLETHPDRAAVLKTLVRVSKGSFPMNL